MVCSPLQKDQTPKNNEKYQAYAAHWLQRKAEARSRLKQRHQDGLKTAKALADILKSDFGATKVALFGSMLSVNNIHMHSDIDLAVWDMPFSAYIKALSKLMAYSGEFSVDLVRIEEAPPSLSAYIDREGLILGEHIPVCAEDLSDYRYMKKHTVLIARIHRELSQITTQFEESHSQLTTAKETDQNAYWMAVSLGLHSIYTGIEKIFEQIAHHVDDQFSKDKHWHKLLLEQMATDIPGIRTAVIDFQTLEVLEEFLRFRHVVRSNYAYRLEPERIEANFHLLEQSYESLVRQLNDFCEFLAAVD